MSNTNNAKVMSPRDAKGRFSSNKEHEMKDYTSKDLPKGFSIKNGKIHVTGMYNNKTVRKNTGITADHNGYAFALDHRSEDDKMQVLLNLIVENEEDTSMSDNFLKYGLQYLEESSEGKCLATQKDYIHILKNIIAPYFSSYKLSEINDKKIRIFLMSLKDDNNNDNECTKKEDGSRYSGDRCTKIKRTFSRIMSQAKYDEYISKDPFKSDLVSKITFKNSSKKQAYTKDEIVKIITKSTGWLHVYLHLAFVYGPRQCEILGLKWSNIDLEKKKICIRGAVTKGEYIVGSQGNKEHYRDIPIMDVTVKLLKELWIHNTMGNEFVFVPAGRRKNSEHWADVTSINKNHFQPLLNKLGITYKTLGSTRNSFVTLELSTGISFALDAAITGKIDKDHPSLIKVKETLGHKENSSVAAKDYFKPNTVEHDEEMKIVDTRYTELITSLAC